MKDIIPNLDPDNDMANYLDSIGIGTLFLDTNLCVRKFTACITKEININASDIGCPIHSISHNLVNDDLNKSVIYVMNTQMSYEKEVKSKYGSWYLLKCAPYRTVENSCQGVIISLIDITRYKCAENEAIVSETLETEFLSNLSHELRTPLNVILSTLQLMDVYMRNGSIHTMEAKFKKHIKIMKRNCYRQLRLINNMIDITRLDAGFFRLELKNCNIVDLVENVTMLVYEYIKNKSIELIFDTDIEVCTIACDPDKIERAILNLLSNSIKFTEEGGSMAVNIHYGGNKILISIRDTGIGIPPDKIGIVFDRFRRVDRSLTRNHEGSGIGLSIVKSIIELHGGKISVSSEYGKGTEFNIELPIIVLNEEEAVNEAVENKKQERIERINMEFSDIYSLT